MHPAILSTRFPPSFDGNPWSYGFALFSLTLVSAISLTILAGWVLEARNRDEIDRRVNNYLTRPSQLALSPFGLHRLTEAGFLITIFLGAFPDVMVLLAWGEATDNTMLALFFLDRFCDAVLLLPFLATALLLIWGGQIIDHRLEVEPLRVRLRPSWKLARQNIKMGVIVLILAIGVTYAKAGV